ATKVVVALARAGHLDPAGEILLFLPWLLSKEVIGDAKSHLPPFMQLFDNRIVLGVILIATASVNDAGKAEPIQFAHEMTCGIHLVFRRQLRSFCQRGVKDCRVRPSNEEAGRISFAVVLDLSARRIWGIFGVTARAQRGLI